MRYLVFTLFVFILITAQSKVVLPDVLSDNMVLQQKSYITLWGKASARKYVRIKASWDTKEFKYFTKKDGSWKICIKTPEASFQAHNITFNDGQQTSIENILIGEVWFCSGQSNMEMTFKGFNNQPIAGADEVIQNANPENGIRMLRVKRNPQTQPVKTAEGKWMLSTSLNVPDFSATAYFYALTLRKKLNVPIGIINSSWGGSSVEGWMSRDLVDNYSDFDLNQPIPDNENWKKPCIMFNGMLKPYTDYVIKGFVWYQGESNIGRYATYAEKLRDMATLWRYEWGLGQLPFYIVEIAPYLYDHPTNAAKLREAQFKTTTILEKSWIVSTNDLVLPEECNIVHPCLKLPIGERLATLALQTTYGFDTLCAQGPSFASMDISNNEIIIHLNNCKDSIQNTDNFIGFEIAGEDQQFFPAKAVLHENKCSLVLQSMEVQNPVAVRYCFKNYAVGNVKNSCGWPLFAFRTDTWDN